MTCIINSDSIAYKIFMSDTLCDFLWNLAYVTMKNTLDAMII